MKASELIKVTDIKNIAYNICKDFTENLPGALKHCSRAKFTVTNNIAFIEIPIQGDLVHQSVYINYTPPKTIETELGVFEVKKCVYGSFYPRIQKKKEDAECENILNFNANIITEERNGIEIEKLNKALNSVRNGYKSSEDNESSFHNILSIISSHIPKNMLHNISIRTSINNKIIVTIYKNENLGIVEGSLQKIKLPKKIEDYNIELNFCDEHVKMY